MGLHIRERRLTENSSKFLQGPHPSARLGTREADLGGPMFFLRSPSPLLFFLLKKAHKRSQSLPLGVE